MKLADYPPQEPLSEAGQAYSLECFRRSEGIAYEEFSYGPSPWQGIAVYRAPKPDGNVLVCWHGGGWTSGYKEWMGFMAPALNAAGITLVSPGYRLAPQTLWPEGLADCVAAVRWTHDNIARFGGDPKRIFLGGHSAGGHYSTLLAVTRDWRGTAGLPDDLIRGALPISGVYDFTPGNGMASRPRFLGADEANDRQASPLHRMEKPLPRCSSRGARTTSRTWRSRPRCSWRRCAPPAATCTR